MEYWKDHEKEKDGVPNLVPRPDYEKEKDGVMEKFRQARRVLAKLNIDIRPLSQKRKAHVIVKSARPAAVASVSALGSSATLSLSAVGPTTSPPLTVSTPASAALATHLENHIKTETEMKAETHVTTSAAASFGGEGKNMYTKYTCSALVPHVRTIGSAQDPWHTNPWHGGAGLLVEGGPGDGDAGVRDKFTHAASSSPHPPPPAQHVLGMIGGAGSRRGGGHEVQNLHV